MTFDGPELIGTHVHLLPMTEAHIDGLYHAGQYPEIWAYLPMFIRTRAEMAQLVQNALRAKQGGREFPFVIVAAGTGEIVGSTRFLDISPQDRHLEIGWTWLTPRVWRTVINTECKYQLLKYSFDTLQMLRVQIKTDGRNLRSQRAIERIGGTREGILRKHRIMPDGYIRDSVYYSVLDDEWPQVKARLEQFLQI